MPMPMLETNPYASLLVLQGEILLCHTLQPLAHSADLQPVRSSHGHGTREPITLGDGRMPQFSNCVLRGLAKIKKFTILTGLLLWLRNILDGAGLIKAVNCPPVAHRQARDARANNSYRWKNNAVLSLS